MSHFVRVFLAVYVATLVLILVLDAFDIAWLDVFCAPARIPVSVQWIDRTTGYVSDVHEYDHREYDLQRVVHTQQVPQCTMERAIVEQPKIYVHPPPGGHSGFVRACAELLRAHFFRRGFTRVRALVTIDLRAPQSTAPGNHLGLAWITVLATDSSAAVCARLDGAIRERRANPRHEPLSNWFRMTRADVIFNNVRNGENLGGRASHLRVFHKYAVTVPPSCLRHMFMLSHDGDGWYIARLISFEWYSLIALLFVSGCVTVSSAVIFASKKKIDRYRK